MHHQMIQPKINYASQGSSGLYQVPTMPDEVCKRGIVGSVPPLISQGMNGIPAAGTKSGKLVLLTEDELQMLNTYNASQSAQGKAVSLRVLGEIELSSNLAFG